MHTECTEDHYEFVDGKLVERKRVPVIVSELVTPEMIIKGAMRKLNDRELFNSKHRVIGDTTRTFIPKKVRDENDKRNHKTYRGEEDTHL